MLLKQKKVAGETKSAVTYVTYVHVTTNFCYMAEKCNLPWVVIDIPLSALTAVGPLGGLYFLFALL